jgi:hypothetical protein
MGPLGGMVRLALLSVHRQGVAGYALDQGRGHTRPKADVRMVNGPGRAGREGRVEARDRRSDQQRQI